MRDEVGFDVERAARVPEHGVAASVHDFAEPYDDVTRWIDGARGNVILPARGGQSNVTRVGVPAEAGAAILVARHLLARGATRADARIIDVRNAAVLE